MTGPREWSPRWGKRTVEDIKHQVEAWLQANDFKTDIHVYTQKEWNARGEIYGTTAVVTIAAEGQFYHVMNYPEGKHDYKLNEKFRAFLDGLGLWYEQGYAWTWHLYPTDEAGPIAMGEAGEKKPLLTLLSSIALTRPDLVLMQGREWFRIEKLIRQARRDVANSEEAKRALEAPIYSATEEGGKLIIWRDVAGGRKATFVEPGTPIETEL